MEQTFGALLKQLREKYFPGKSLRVVCEELGLGQSFFTYLSKMENGSLLPSEEVLKSLMDAFKLKDNDGHDLVTSYLAEKMVKYDLRLSQASSGLLYRKIKKRTAERDES